jgi:hypothetical protein
MHPTYLEEETRVTFELQGTLPIFRERYVSPQAGTVVLKGFFSQTAHIETLDGTRYRMLQPKRDRTLPNQIVFPVVYLPHKESAFRLLSPLRDTGSGQIPRLRFTTTFGDGRYVFRQVRAGRREFELWDGMEMQRLVRREPSRALIADSTVLIPVPAVLVLLIPWLDNQTALHRRS